MTAEPPQTLRSLDPLIRLPYLKMKRLYTLAPLILATATLLVGCAKQREISGEIFTRDSKGVVMQSGVAIHFLTAKEREQFELLLKGWRNKEYQEDNELMISASKEYTELFATHKNEDGKVYKKDIIKELDRLQWVVAAAKRRIEEKEYDDKISLDDRAMKLFLASVHRIAADTEGKFKVTVSLGREYWIVAESHYASGGTWYWYFRYTPDGTNLVLSRGNATR